MNDSERLVSVIQNTIKQQDQGWMVVAYGNPQNPDSPFQQPVEVAYDRLAEAVVLAVREWIEETLDQTQEERATMAQGAMNVLSEEGFSYEDAIVLARKEADEVLLDAIGEPNK